ncbi:mucin-2 isoform X2 [Centropristis striata]|uniref:mucin-2 isoform X2 n=1 Tax=Centropristis striata TaxID=184440 RepID=UPI0027E0BD55|nr:mucin-2 isoform X2 [Centropristis striata]
MSADDFQTKYSSVMEGMLKGAIAETTKLFETMVDELKAEISKIKKENEDLKTRCSQFEKTRSEPSGDTGDTGESEPAAGPSCGAEKHDRAVQCDLVPFRTVLVEQCQPLRHSLQNQEQQCLHDHNYGEGCPQMAFILVKQEDSYDDCSPQSAIKQEEEEVEPAVVCGLVLSDKSGSTQESACGTETEGPLINKECSTGGISLPLKDAEARLALELPCLRINSGSQEAQNQSSELEHSIVISLAAINHNMEEESEVSQKISETPENPLLVIAQNQSEVESIEKEQTSVVPQQCRREGETSEIERTDVTLQQNTDVQSTKSVRRRGRPPKKAKQPARDTGSPAVSAASLSRDFSSEKEKTFRSQQSSMEMEEGAIQVSSANETKNTPEGQPRERHTSVTLQDAMLLVEAMNQSPAEKTLSSPQRMAAPTQNQCALSVGTLRFVDKVPAEVQTPPLPVKSHKPAGNLDVTEMSTTTQSTVEKLSAPSVTADATPTSKTQAHIKGVLPNQQHRVTPSNTITSSSAAAVQTNLMSFQQQTPHHLITPVAAQNPGETASHKIIVMPRTYQKIAALSPTQLPAVVSTVVAAQKKSLLSGSATTSLPPASASLSPLPQKTIFITSTKSLPVATSQSTATLTDPQLGTLSHPKITIIIPRRMSAVASRMSQSQAILTTKQESAKFASPVTMSSPLLISELHELSDSMDTHMASDEVVTISSQKRDNTSDSLESPKQTDFASETIDEPTGTSFGSVWLVPTPSPPVVPPTSEQKISSAVVRLTRLPVSVSANKAVFVSRLPKDGSSENQSILKDSDTQEKPSSPLVMSTQTLATDICPNIRQTSVPLSVNAPQVSEEQTDIQEKASLSSDNWSNLQESPYCSLSTPPSVPVFENSTIAVKTSEPPAVAGKACETTPYSDEEIFEVCQLPYEPTMEERQSAAPIQLIPITKDPSDPHLQMTKAQFLAQLAVTPVMQEPQTASSNDFVHATSSHSETFTPDKKRLQRKSLVARLQNHLKAHSRAKRTGNIPEPRTETEPHTSNPRQPTLENNSPNNEKATSKAVPLSPEDPRAVEDVTSPNKTNDDPTPMSPLRSGLCTGSARSKRTADEQTPVPSERFKATTESTLETSRRSIKDRVAVGSKTETSTSVSPRRCSSTKENTSPKKTQSTSVSSRRPSPTKEAKENANPKKTKSSSVSPRRSSTKISNPKNTRSTSVSQRRTRSTRDDISPQNGATPKKTKTTSMSPRRINSTRDGTNSKNSTSPKSTKTTSVTLKRISSRKDIVSQKSSEKGASPKMSTNELPYFCRRRCTLPKDGPITKEFKRESNSFSARYSTSTDGASTSANAMSEIGLVRWPGLDDDGQSPKKSRESTPAKKPRFIHEAANPQKNLRVLNAKKLAQAAKAKTIAKMRNSSQSKMQNVAKTSQLAEGHASGGVLRKFTATAVWIPPICKTPPGQKKEAKSPRSPDSPLVYPPSISLFPIPIRGPPVVSPLQPLSVIGRRLLKNQCGECGRVLSSVAALESHVRLHTGRRPYSCTLCGKGFPDSKGLKRHGRVHRNGRIHICPECGKGFVYRFGLTKHLQMVHTRIKPFICQICNKGFFSKRDVEAHIRMHTGEKPFHCNLCDKKFARRVELNVHLRWHNGEKRHWCPYCGKGFLDSNNLKRHKYIHTGERPHACPHCPKNFTQSGHLKKHVKNVHRA